MTNEKPSSKTVARALRSARALIRKGWIKGAFQGDHTYSSTGEFLPGSFCTIGAIRKVDGPAEGEAKRLIRRAIKELFYPARKSAFGTGDVYTFNDGLKRQKADVLRAFDRAIEMAEETV